jgi:hypothetical protein
MQLPCHRVEKLLTTSDLYSSIRQPLSHTQWSLIYSDVEIQWFANTGRLLLAASLHPILPSGSQDTAGDPVLEGIGRALE